MKHSMVVGILMVTIIALGVVITGYLKMPTFAGGGEILRVQTFNEDAQTTSALWGQVKEPLSRAIQSGDEQSAQAIVKQLQEKVIAMRVDAAQVAQQLSRVTALETLLHVLQSSEKAQWIDALEVVSRNMAQ